MKGLLIQMKLFKKLLNKLFCKHEHVKRIGFQEQYDAIRNIRHSKRTYRCSNCGKVFTVDVRRGIYDR
jgi:transposase-like protein